MIEYILTFTILYKGPKIPMRIICTLIGNNEQQNLFKKHFFKEDFLFLLNVLSTLSRTDLLIICQIGIQNINFVLVLISISHRIFISL